MPDKIIVRYFLVTFRDGRCIPISGVDRRDAIITACRVVKQPTSHVVAVKDDGIAL